MCGETRSGDANKAWQTVSASLRHCTIPRWPLLDPHQDLDDPDGSDS